MEAMDPDVMDSASIIWAATTYAVANMDNRLPWNGTYPDVMSVPGVGIKATPTIAVTVTMLMFLFL